jgi:hypothetical protein
MGARQPPQPAQRWRRSELGACAKSIAAVPRSKSWQSAITRLRRNGELIVQRIVERREAPRPTRSARPSNGAPFRHRPEAAMS